MTAAPEGTEGAFLCAVERVIQDVFTTIVLLRPEGAASGAPLLRMELEREDAPTVLDNQLVWISVQPRDILLLKLEKPPLYPGSQCIPAVSVQLSPASRKPGAVSLN